jgi:hypothetical protein
MRNIMGTDVMPFVIGDCAYPVITWLVKPFVCNTSLAIEQKDFNYHLSKARMVIEK